MSKLNFLLVLSIVFCLIYPSLGSNAQVTPFWGYNCIDSQCVRVQANGSNIHTVLSLSPCVLKCNEFGTLWPRPTNVTTWNNTILSIDWSNVSIRKMQHTGHSGHIPRNYVVRNNQQQGNNNKHTNKKKTPKDFMSYWEQSVDRFNQIIDAKIGDSQLVDGKYCLSISLYVESDDMDINLDTDEQYQLQVETHGKQIEVLLRSFNYFGARHALETLSQLIAFDEFSSQLKILSNVFISDAPVYKHRGILVDTARRYYSVDAIKKTIDVMAMSKLNVFHWRITDSFSFAMVLDSHPQLSQKGAFSPKKVYYPSDIKEIVEYGRVRGVRILPEFMAPSHVGEGFQDTNLVTCLYAQPWESYCYAPPCGQFDATKDELYELLQDIYSEMNEMFDDPAQFHMGGDEVFANCWNTSTDVRDWMIARGWELTQDGYLKLWNYFKERALAIYRNITLDDKRAILWTSSLTDEEVIDEYLSPDDYVIQIWLDGSGESSQIPHLLEKGYDIIISNRDVLFLSRGFGSWNGAGGGPPYNPWHLIYDNNFRSLVGNRTSQVLGGEVIAFSSQIDDRTLDARLWPRASAFGERLWSDPNTNFRAAENRILLHREFLVQYGVNAESIQPEWCVQNLGECPYNN